MKHIPILFALVMGVASTLPAMADTLLIQRVQAGAQVNLPKRGSSMQAVAASFGAPVRKFPAVGGGSRNMPPITRWEYPAFSVYFENDHVVDAVLSKASPLEIGPAPATPG